MGRKRWSLEPGMRLRVAVESVFLLLTLMTFRYFFEGRIDDLNRVLKMWVGVSLPWM